MGNSFKMGFDIANYKDILPDWEDYLKNDYIINGEDFEKGNIEECYWKKYNPSMDEINSLEFQEREARRILKTGVWIAIKNEILWFPPNVYFALQSGRAGSVDMQFRLKRLQTELEKIRARKNAGCMGTLLIKCRGEGETTFEVTNSLWECLDGNMETGQIGIQSYNRAAAINPCWSYAQTLWHSLPQWQKKLFYSDFVSGNNIAEKMQWQRPTNEEAGIKSRNVLFTYYPSGTPMDGKHDVKKCLLDEIAKWEECSFYHTFTNYKKFIMPGFERRGMFAMFSSPSDKNNKSNEEVYELWCDSNPKEIDEDTGTTKSRIHRIYSNPLHGIHGAYDKYGDADPERIYDHIIKERKKLPKDKLLAEVRGFPLNEQEMFESTEGNEFWDNRKGIKERQIYLLGTRVKDIKTGEPIKVFGNLEWKEGIVDHPLGVDFRQSDKYEFDVEDSRFAFTVLPNFKDDLKNIFIPPDYIESALGVDPFGKRHPGKKFSNGAGVIYKFRDLYETGINKMVTGLYINRPYHEDIFFEDMIKACVFTRSKLQFEANHDRIGGYFTDRNYKEWVLPQIGEKRGSDRLGDNITARGKFMDEMVGLINAYTNIPVDKTQECLLDKIWFIELIDDLLKFNLKDTHENDAVMAMGQALMASAKMMFMKQRQKSEFNDNVFDYLFT